MKYFLWFTCIIPEYDNRLIAGFVKKGYEVSCAAKGNKVVSGEADRSAVVIGLLLHKLDTGPDTISTDLQDITRVEGMYYHSYVISEQTANCSWNSGNIAMPSYAPDIPKADAGDNNLN